MKKALLLLLFLGFLANANASGYLQTASDRPLKSGQLEVSLKSAYQHDAMGFDYQGNAKNLVNGPSLNFILGLGPFADFELNWDILRFTQSQDNSTSQDISDVSFFTRLRFKKEGRGPSFGLRLGAKLPNASDETKAGTDLTDTFVWAVLGKQLGAVHLFSNLGLEIFDKAGGGQHDAFGYGFAASLPLTQKLSFSSELAGRYEREGSGVNQSVLRTGLSYQLDPWKLGIAISRGLISESENFGVKLGITKVFDAF